MNEGLHEYVGPIKITSLSIRGIRIDERTANTHLCAWGAQHAAHTTWMSTSCACPVTITNHARTCSGSQCDGLKNIGCPSHTPINEDLEVWIRMRAPLLQRIDHLHQNLYSGAGELNRTSPVSSYIRRQSRGISVPLTACRHDSIKQFPDSLPRRPTRHPSIAMSSVSRMTRS